MSHLVTPLFHREFGGRPRLPLVILHGFLGSSRNWQIMGRHLADDFHVYLVDLRNHGQSPHVEGSGYAAQADDLLRWLDSQRLARAHLLGHSMGGKVAMRFACEHPERVSRLTVVDIAPREYRAGSAELRAMVNLDLGSVESRRGASELLRAEVPDEATRNFLLTNLARTEDGQYRWTVHLEALDAGLPELRRSPLLPDHIYRGAVQWIVAGRSSFVEPNDEDIFRRHFSDYRLDRIEESGHNPHVEAPARFRELILEFGGSA